jgi:DNA mismatch endonuclease (patch repair protein)
LREGSNPSYWTAKIGANIDRDKRQTKELERSGWRVLRLWETDIMDDPKGAADRIAAIVHARR